MSAQPLPELLTARQVGEWLGMSPATVLRRAGEIAGYRLGSNVLRFQRADIERYLGARYEPSQEC